MKKLTRLLFPIISISIILASCEQNIYDEYPKKQEQDKDYRIIPKSSKDSPKWDAVKNTQEKKASDLEVYKKEIEVETETLKEEFSLPCYHKIKHGDTASEIIETYNRRHPYYFELTIDKLKNMNHFIVNENYIFPEMPPVRLRWGCD